LSGAKPRQGSTCEEQGVRVAVTVTKQLNSL